MHQYVTSMYVRLAESMPTPLLNDIANALTKIENHWHIGLNTFSELVM